MRDSWGYGIIIGVGLLIILVAMYAFDNVIFWIGIALFSAVTLGSLYAQAHSIVRGLPEKRNEYETVSTTISILYFAVMLLTVVVLSMAILMVGKLYFSDEEAWRQNVVVNLGAGLLGSIPSFLFFTIFVKQLEVINNLLYERYKKRDADTALTNNRAELLGRLETIRTQWLVQIEKLPDIDNKALTQADKVAYVAGGKRGLTKAVGDIDLILQELRRQIETTHPNS